MAAASLPAPRASRQAGSRRFVRHHPDAATRGDTFQVSPENQRTQDASATRGDTFQVSPENPRTQDASATACDG